MAKLNVAKWQAARRSPAYSPVMQFSLRMIRTALFEAMRAYCVPCPYPASDAQPVTVADHLAAICVETWDAAVMARDWIARPTPSAKDDLEGYLLSFDAACDVLGLNAEYERMWMLQTIDADADFDTDEVWARIEFLTINPPDESVEPLFDAPRCVPALDQGNLFSLMEAA